MLKRDKMKNFWIKFLATGFGGGYSPIFPGAVGTILGFGVALLFSTLPYYLRVVLAIIFTIVAIPVSSRAENFFQEKDCSKIIIDEIVGVLIASLSLVNPGWVLIKGIKFPLLLFGAMLLFGLFDALKPFPANIIQKLPGGWGVVLDDVVAGIYAAVVMILILKFWV